MKRNMKNYAEVLKKFQKLLHKNGWPQTLWITPGMYWDVIIASEDEIVPDWRFLHPTGEDEGFPFFIIGPTMVRPIKSHANSVRLETFAPTTREEKFVAEMEKNESLTPENKAYLKEKVAEGGPMLKGGVDDARE